MSRDGHVAVVSLMIGFVSFFAILPGSTSSQQSARKLLATHTVHTFIQCIDYLDNINRKCNP